VDRLHPNPELIDQEDLFKAVARIIDNASEFKKPFSGTGGIAGEQSITASPE
jgi:hypothetical protein